MNDPLGLFSEPEASPDPLGLFETPKRKATAKESAVDLGFYEGARRAKELGNWIDKKASDVLGIFSEDAAKNLREEQAKRSTKIPEAPKDVEQDIWGKGLSAIGQAPLWLSGPGSVAMSAGGGLKTTRELKEQGVDEKTAETAGWITGGSDLAMSRLPAGVKGSIPVRVGSGAAIGGGSAAAGNLATREYLEGSGYKQQADNMKPMGDDILLGTILGGILGPAAGAKPRTQPKGKKMDSEPSKAVSAVEASILADKAQQSVASPETPAGTQLDLGIDVPMTRKPKPMAEGTDEHGRPLTPEAERTPLPPEAQGRWIGQDPATEAAQGDLFTHGQPLPNPKEPEFVPAVRGEQRSLDLPDMSKKQARARQGELFDVINSDLRTTNEVPNRPAVSGEQMGLPMEHPSYGQLESPQHELFGMVNATPTTHPAPTPRLPYDPNVSPEGGRVVSPHAMEMHDNQGQVNRLEDQLNTIEELVAANNERQEARRQHDDMMAALKIGNRVGEAQPKPIKATGQLKLDSTAFKKAPPNQLSLFPETGQAGTTTKPVPLVPVDLDRTNAKNSVKPLRPIPSKLGGVGKKQGGATTFFNFGGKRPDKSAPAEKKTLGKEFGNELPEFHMQRDPDVTRQEILSPTFKDFGPGEGNGIKNMLAKVAAEIGNNLRPGLRHLQVVTNSPLAKLTLSLTKDSVARAAKFDEKYLTGNESNTLPNLRKEMSIEEFAEVDHALRLGDKHEQYLTEKNMASLNDVQKEYIRQFYKADKERFIRENEARVAKGQKPISERQGHYPGVFNGDYKSLVYKKGKNGELEILAVIATDSKYGQNKAQEATRTALAKEHGSELIFTPVVRKSLTGSHRVDMFQGLQEIIKTLGEHYPELDLVAKAVNDSRDLASANIYGMGKHAMAKKGVMGSEGNKPWKTAEQNAQDAYKASIKYLSNGMLQTELSHSLPKINSLLSDPDIQAKAPNSVKAVQEYVNSIEGTNLNDIGRMFNTGVDVILKGTGVGSTAGIQANNQVRTRMSQYMMGYGSIPFTIAQFGQLLTSYAPFVQLAAGRFGEPVSIANQFSKASADMTKIMMKEYYPSKAGKLPGELDQIHEYMKDRGIMSFSETERLHEIANSPTMQNINKGIEANIILGEKMTRPTAFLGFVNTLQEVTKGRTDWPLSRVLEVSENLTQYAMIDYHPFERPQLFQKLGVIGNTASALQTYKFGTLGQAKKLAQEFKDKRNAAPMATMLAMTLGVGGVMGLHGFDDANDSIKWLGNLFGQDWNMKKMVLENLDLATAMGKLGEATGTNIGTRMTLSNIVPDSLSDATSSQYATLGKMIGSIFEAISNGGTPQDIKNATKALLPNSLKGPFEENFNREGDGLINKKAQLERERSDKDWMKRGTLGLYSPEEVKDRTLGYENNTIKAAHMKRRTQIMEDLKYRYRQGALSDEFFSKKIEQYIKFGGDPSTIASTLEKDYAESRGKTTRMRQAGTPSGITSTHDYLLMEDMRP